MCSWRVVVLLRKVVGAQFHHRNTAVKTGLWSINSSKHCLIMIIIWLNICVKTRTWPSPGSSLNTRKPDPLLIYLTCPRLISYQIHLPHSLSISITFSILCSMDVEGVSGIGNDYETVDMSAVVASAASAQAASSPCAEAAAEESHPAVTHGK